MFEVEFEGEMKVPQGDERAFSTAVLSIFPQI
jgi:hypothetical protein